MSPLPYLQSELPRALRGLSRPGKIAFALLCAERLVSAEFAPAPTVVRLRWEAASSALNTLWAILYGTPIDATAADRCQSALLALLPPSEEPTLDGECRWSEFADNCVTAVIYAARSTYEDARDNAVWSANCALEGWDIAEHFRAASDLIVGLGRAPSFAWMKQEEARQLADIADLRALEPSWPAAPIAQLGELRARARATRVPLG
jgi:hypothetical protein